MVLVQGALDLGALLQMARRLTPMGADLVHLAPTCAWCFWREFCGSPENIFSLFKFLLSSLKVFLVVQAVLEEMKV